MPSQWSLVFLSLVAPRFCTFQALDQYPKGVFPRTLRCKEIIFSHFLGIATVGQLFKSLMDSSTRDFCRFEGGSFL